MTSEEGILADIKAWYLDKYEKNQVLTIFLTGMFLMMAIVAILSLFTGGNAFIYGNLHPNQSYWFMDHFSMVADSYENPYTKHGEIYPPLGICLYAIIAFFTVPMVSYSGSSWNLALAMRDAPGPMAVFVILIIALIISFYIVYKKYAEKDLGRAGYNMVFISLLFSYPVVFGISTGNYIFLSVLCCILYIYGYDSDDKKIRYFAYICLGVAAGLKITPAFLAVLTLKRKGWLELGKCVVIVTALLLVPFIFTDGDPISYVRHVIEYASSVPASFGFLNINDLLDALGLSIYAALGVEVIVLGIVLLFILMDDEMERWEEATILGCLLMLIFSVSVSYTLLYLEIGLMLLLTTHKKVTDKGMMLCLICFIGIFCLMPGFEPAQKYVGTIKAILMLVLLFYIFGKSAIRMYKRFKEPKKEEPELKSPPNKTETKKTYSKNKVNKSNRKSNGNRKNNRVPRRS